MLGTGTADEILSDLEALGTRGFSQAVVHLDCPTGTMTEYRDRLERFATTVLPGCGGLAVGGPWASAPL